MRAPGGASTQLKEKSSNFYLQLRVLEGGGRGEIEHNCMYLPSTLPKIDDSFNDSFTLGTMDDPKPKTNNNFAKSLDPR